MQYQSFPGVKGGSSSFEKLKCLRLPDIENKRFLDVGCNEGFFCGFAQFQGARQVVGIDHSADDIRRAKIRFPDVEFLNQSWDNLPDGPFDVITMLSALHYAEDQAELIHRLVDLLSDDGVLVLEIGIVQGGKNEWVKVERSIDSRFYPTRNKISTILERYAWKIVGYSVNQAGDPVQRYVIHIRKFKPYAYLLMENPGSGKSTICRRLFHNAKVPVVSGDDFYRRISEGKIENVSDELFQLVKDNFRTTQLDKITSLIFDKDLSNEMVDLWAAEAGFNDFALDTYIPSAERDRIYSLFEGRAYFPVNISWDTRNRLSTVGESSRKADAYHNFLLKESTHESDQTVFCVKKRLPSSYRNLVKWHLDSPSDGELFFEDMKARVSGWLVPLWDVQTGFNFYVRSGEDEIVKPFNVKREDALRHALGDGFAAEGYWKENVCGFSVGVPLGFVQAGFEVGFIFEGKRVSLAEVTLKKRKDASSFSSLMSGFFGKTSL